MKQRFSLIDRPWLFLRGGLCRVKPKSDCFIFRNFFELSARSHSSLAPTYYSKPLVTDGSSESKNVSVSGGTGCCMPVITSNLSHSSMQNVNLDVEYKDIYRPYTINSWMKVFLELSKAKLSALVVFTTVSGFALAPFSHELIVHGLLASPLLFFKTSVLIGSTIIGTALCSFSANAFNQWMEAPFDAQMSRTKNRPIPRHVISSPHAFTFATLSGFTGFNTLFYGADPLAAFMALGTIVLYAGVYTPMKRYSIANTWIGAVVGSIPPLIGWAAAQSNTALEIFSSLTSAELLFSKEFAQGLLGLGPGAWILASTLYIWQFPHFCSLSWNSKADYAKAGYCMSSVLDPALNLRVSLRYSLAFIPLTIGACFFHVTTPLFLVIGNIVNALLIFPAWRFYRLRNRPSARKLFFSSLIHLPLFLFGLFLCKHPEMTYTIPTISM
jgi:protoheme IX farnesyltransferase